MIGQYISNTNENATVLHILLNFFLTKQGPESKAKPCALALPLILFLQKTNPDGPDPLL